MRKTLILVVDRDDDFGAKAGVKSPVIGVEACTDAATALGIADPEDSDTNALFAALNMYHDMEKDDTSGDFEVALICGHQKVGYKSDIILVDQLEEVLDEVKPDRAILVGDGAEDEYIYPIITSRVPIDSVRKVYVKQAPGVEGTLYIMKRMLEDPQKRERFIGPVSWLLVALCIIYMIPAMYEADSITDFLTGSVTIIIFFVIGLLLMSYAYNLDERMSNFYRTWRNRASHGSLTTVFSVAAVLMAIVGVVVGFYSNSDVYTDRLTQEVILFAVSSMWFFLFAIMIYVFGLILDRYMSSRKIRYSFITFILDLVSIGLIMNGILDYLMDYVDLYTFDTPLYILEVVAGFALSFLATALLVRFKKVYSSEETGVQDEVQ